jgi:hypothetical protein
VVVHSSTKAEYQSIAITTAELYWLRLLFKEFKISLASSPVLWCDNVGALAFASNTAFHTRTIEVDYHFIREKVVNCDICIKFISSSDQVADIFSKGLTTTHFILLPIVHYT